MSEQIVACPGCGKKFRIPDGSPPSGSFACTACGADVVWGGAAAKGAAAKGASKPAGAKAGRGGDAGKTSSSGARRAKARRAREEAATSEPEAGAGRRSRAAPSAKEKNTLPIVLSIGGAVALIGVLVIVFTSKPTDPLAEAQRLQEEQRQAQAREESGTPVGKLTSSGTPTGTQPDTPKPETPKAETPATAPTPTVETPKPPDSGIGAVAEGSDGRDYAYYFKMDPNDLYAVEVPEIAGTTPEEAAEFERQARLAFDFNSGGPGMNAERVLAKAGRKAMPFIIRQFSAQWKASQFKNENEQFGCYKAQQICRQIIKATKFKSDFVARFPHQGDVGPDKFERAARMWTAWWLGEGQYIEQFTPFPDEE